MRRAIKKQGKVVKAYRLGDTHPVTERMMEEGKIRQIDENTYELFSREAVNGRGEIAKKGDWYKVDSSDSPYPNSREFFEINHRHLQGDDYEQIPKPLEFWNLEQDGMCPEIEYLLKNKMMTINSGNEEKYFSANLWGTLLSAAKNTMIVFYNISRDENGNIQDMDFNFVKNSEFYKTYDVIN